MPTPAKSQQSQQSAEPAASTKTAESTAPKRMHILLIHQSFANAGQPGGTRHFELGSQFVKHGHAFTVVASSLDYLTGKPVQSPTKSIRPDAPTIRRAYTYPALHRSFAWRIFSMLTFTLTSIPHAMRAKNVDVVMATSPPPLQLFSAWLVAKLKRVPFLVEVRDLYLEFAIETGMIKNPLVGRMALAFQWFFYKRADHMLVNSPAFREALQNHGVPAERITLIPNGVDPEMFQPESRGEEFVRERGLDGKFLVTYAGALGHVNDIETILRAAGRLKSEEDICFLLAGGGKMEASLQEMAKQLGLSNVQFLGGIPKDKVWQLLAASDVCVATLQDHPILRTTYPNKIFDYMAAGRPIVMGIDGVIREVVEDAKAGFCVTPEDDAALADAILRLQSDEELRQTMGAAGREHVERHFDRKSHALLFEEVVSRLISDQS